MQRILFALALILTFIVTAWSQDTETTTESDDTEPATAEVEQESDDSELDEEHYADIEDDDFRPSEDIPADQSIPFPTDI